MDGTLLNPEGQLTARTISALKDARAHGAVVTLSSGRMPCALRPFVKELGIDAPLICYNGALTVVRPSSARRMDSSRRIISIF